MKIIRDGKIITSTEKAYNTIYKSKGYVLYEEEVKVESKYDYENMTKADIKEELCNLEIEYNDSDTKKVLFELLGSD